MLSAGSHSLSVTFTPTDTGYAPVTQTTTISVTRAVLTVTAVSQTIAYGTTAAPYTATITGYVNGDTSSAVTGTPSLTTSPATPTAVGSYPITPAQGTLAAANYSFTYLSTGSLTITTGTATVSWPSPASIVYGTALSATQLNATASVPGAFAYTPATGTVLSAGSHSLSVTFTPTDTGYAPVTQTTTISVTRAVLTVTAVSQTIAYGTTAAPYTATITGYVNGDTSSAVTGTPSLTTSPATPTAVGSYPITPAQGTLAAANYSFTYLSTGSLTITTGTATVSWPSPASIVYGTALSATQLNATASVPGAFAYTPATGTVLSAGSHSLSVTFTPTDTGYAPVTQTTTISVTRAVLTVTAVSQTIAYGTTAAPYTATITGYVNGDTSSAVTGTPSLTTSPATPTAVGSYPITPAQGTLAAANYSFTYLSTGSLTITTGTATVSWPSPASIVYGTALSATQLNATASVPGAFAYTPATGTVLSAGSHSLSVTFTPTDTGYAPVTQTTTISVTRAVLTVTAVSQTIAYGTTAAPYTATITGYVNGDTSSAVTGTPSLTTSPATPTAVGSYPITPAQGTLAAANYSFTYLSTGSLTITTGTATVSWPSPASIVYGTALSATQLNATASVPGAFAYTPATGTVLSAGSHSLSVTFTPTDTGYAPVTQTTTISVTRAVLTVTAVSQTIAYGTTAAPYTATITGYVNGDTSSAVTGTPSLTTSPATPTAVGSYPITPAQGTLAAANYSFTYLSTGSLTITTGTATVSWPSPASIVYGTALSATQLNATASVPGAFAYTPATGTVLSAGSHSLSVTFTPTDTGYAPVTQTTTISVTRAVLTVTAVSSNRAYGVANPTFSASATGAVNGDTFTFTETTTATTTSPVGTYSIVPVATGTNLVNYTVVYNNGTLTIGQATLTITATDASRTYGAPNPIFSITSAGAVNGDTFTLAASTTATSSSNPGTYPIVPTATGANLANYTVVYVSGTLTVGKATLTVTAANANRNYGVANPTFSASATGAVNGDTFTFTETTPATVTSPVGTYPIVPVATGTNFANYTVVYNNGTLTVGQATLTVTAANANRTYGSPNPTFSASATGAVNGDTFTFTETTTATTTSPIGAYPIVPVATGTNLTNYTVVYNNGTLTVGQATLTVTAANANRTYGSPNPTFSASATGAVNGDTFTFTETTPATATSPVGTYPIVPVAAGTNLSDYTVVYNNGTLTIGQATLTVTAANANRTYGSPNPTFSASATGAVNGDTFTFAETTTATATSPVGTYPIVPVAAGTNLSDYTVVYNNGTLTVGQATLTVTAANANRTYGSPNPTFSASATGAVNGDSFTFTETTPATATSQVGTYPIVPVAAGTNLSDYTVVYNNGTLTIGQATLTVTAANANRTYGSPNPTFSASATGAVNGDTFTFTETTPATVTSPVGTYPIVAVAAGTNLSDYTVVYNNGTLTVGQAMLTVTAANANRTYGSPNPTFSASATGAVNGDTFTFTETTPATATSPVGTYPIVPVATGTNLSDYTVVYNNGTLTVGQATLTVTAANANRIYGTPNPTFSASATGAVNGDTFTFAETTTATATSPVGTYPIVPVATGTNLSDYTVIYNNGTLTIGQATPSITWTSPAPIVYGIALGIAQLDATASVPGALAYTPAAGTILVAGNDTLSVTFTPTDSIDYTPVTKSIQLTVNQATPVITWANPASIVYGTALSNIQLDATASVDGKLVYTPPAGTELMVGPQQLSVTFTPTDLVDYTTVTKTVSLNVTQATLTVAANNFSRLYGTSNPVFTGSVTGTQNGDIFTESFSNSATTLSTVGQYPIIPSVTGTDLADYTQVIQNGTLSITKAPALTTTTLSTTNIAYDLPVTVTANVASTTSGTPTGTVSFFDNGSPLGTGTLSNGVGSYTTTSLSVGTHVITAVYSGDVNFSSSSATGASGTNTVLITPLDFSIQLTSSSTVEGTYGSTRTFTFHLAPIGGTYPGVVQLSASPTGPILATYTFSPNSIGKVAGPMDVTLTVATRKLASSESPKGWPGRVSPVALGLFLLPLLGLRYSRRSAGKLSRILTYSALLLMSLGAIGTMTGCGSGYADHTYPITITATSNGIQHTVSVDYHIDQSPQ